MGEPPTAAVITRERVRAGLEVPQDAECRSHVLEQEPPPQLMGPWQEQDKQEGSPLYLLSSSDLILVPHIVRT